LRRLQIIKLNQIIQKKESSDDETSDDSSDDDDDEKKKKSNLKGRTDKQKNNEIINNNNDIDNKSNSNTTTSNNKETSIEKEIEPENDLNNNSNKKIKPPRTGGQGRFQRIKDIPVDPQLSSNKYDYSDPFATKAHRDLSKVKGDKFNKEKNKKKRNTFFGGGQISMDSNSIKFND